MMRVRRVLTILPMLLLAAVSPVLAQSQVRRIPVQPPALMSAPAVDTQRPGLRRACVPVNAIAGAIVTDDRNVELRLKNGSRWTMRFTEACPALGYYEGFYYRRARAKYLCAGHDAVIARSGGECPIVELVRTEAVKRR